MFQNVMPQIRYIFEIVVVQLKLKDMERTLSKERTYRRLMQNKAAEVWNKFELSESFFILKYLNLVFFRLNEGVTGTSV